METEQSGVPAPLAGTGASLAQALAERLEIATTDRVSSARELVQEAARATHEILRDQEAATTPQGLGAELEAGLDAWAEAHGYRGACARFLDGIRRAYWYGRQTDSEQLSELLQEELGLWTWSTPHLLGAKAWNGEPLAPGARTACLTEQAANAAALLGQDHVVCVPGGSLAVLDALELAREQGKRPRALVCEGGPDGSGRRLASRLAEAGIPVTFTYDHALPDQVHAADRIWLGTEAVGAAAFLARKGTERVLHEARAEGVPVEVLATADDLLPGGNLELPTWCQSEPWLLWDYAPEGITLETQLYEKVDFEWIDAFLTDAGLERPTAFHMRALRTETSLPCDA